MKNITFCLLFAVISGTAFAQTAKPKPVAKKPAAKPMPAALKTPLDSFSYALGMTMVSFYKEQGVTNINTNLVVRAINDAKNGTPLLDESQANNCVVSFMGAARSDKAAPAKKEGKAFLDSNKLKPGVVVLPSGLQYQIVQAGTGPKPGLTDKVKVHYEGKLINGKIFDSSIQRGEPIELNVNGVIPGWTEALQLMPVGSKWKLFIPSDLAYGDSQAGADIVPGSTLIFDVQLLDIIRPQGATNQIDTVK